MLATISFAMSINVFKDFWNYLQPRICGLPYVSQPLSKTKSGFSKRQSAQRRTLKQMQAP